MNPTTFTLYAMIRPSSKYFHQGLVDPTNSSSARRVFEVVALFPDADRGYPVRTPGNRYRLEDVDLCVVDNHGRLQIINCDMRNSNF